MTNRQWRGAWAADRSMPLLYLIHCLPPPWQWLYYSGVMVGECTHSGIRLGLTLTSWQDGMIPPQLPLVPTLSSGPHGTDASFHYGPSHCTILVQWPTPPQQASILHKGNCKQTESLKLSQGLILVTGLFLSLRAQSGCRQSSAVVSRRPINILPGLFPFIEFGVVLSGDWTF